MIGKKKRRLVWYLPWDGTYAERHLEKMARKGWRLENAGNPFWIYRRAEPANLRYAITYFPTASVFDRCGLGDGVKLRPPPDLCQRPAKPGAY